MINIGPKLKQKQTSQCASRDLLLSKAPASRNLGILFDPKLPLISM